MESKTCNTCNETKTTEDFYICQGRMQPLCKQCVIIRNTAYQKKKKSWLYRFVDKDTERSYMKEYYHKNKERYARYSKKFRDKNPEYFKLYARAKKEEKNSAR